MGAGGIPNHGTIITTARSLESQGKPNSKIQRYRNGKLVQERWYDNQGKAIRNRDYSHGGNEEFPHDHSWTWNGKDGHRGTEHLKPDFDNFK